jgi:hypothetical protein
LTIANEKQSNVGLPAWAVGDEFDTDWQAVLNKSAMQVEHNLSLSGGTEKNQILPFIRIQHSRRSCC